MMSEHGKHDVVVPHPLNYAHPTPLLLSANTG